MFFFIFSYICFTLRFFTVGFKDYANALHLILNYDLNTILPSRYEQLQMPSNKKCCIVTVIIETLMLHFDVLQLGLVDNSDRY